MLSLEVALGLILVAVIAYLLGSFPTARLIAGKKVLEKGTGNVGTMNVYRTTGSPKLTALTFIIDAGKAVLAVLIVSWLGFFGYQPLIGLLVASFFVILGHNYSMFLEFRGGRGLASLFGLVLILCWPASIICLAVIGVSIWVTEAVLISMGKSKVEWRKLFSISTLNSQILGRIIGMFLCILPLYLLVPGVLICLLPAILLSLLRHGGRLWEYLKVMSKVKK